ncbi:MAG TPA: hypothetical protein VIO14_03340 [Dehalococcoidia bacterium]
MSSLYEQVIGVAKPYLGLVTEQFVARQCTAHLKVQPQALTPAQIPELAKWVEISGALVMDKAKAAELKEKILKLAA